MENVKNLAQINEIKELIKKKNSELIFLEIKSSFNNDLLNEDESQKLNQLKTEQKELIAQLRAMQCQYTIDIEYLVTDPLNQEIWVKEKAIHYSSIDCNVDTNQLNWYINIVDYHDLKNEIYENFSLYRYSHYRLISIIKIV